MGPGDPIIRFLRLHSGERLAFATHGQGPLLVCPAWWVSHLEEDWADEGFRSFFGALARHFTVVRYDRVGAGLSDRARERVDLDSEMSTLAELTEHLGSERASLFAVSCAGPPALAFAAAHPERVARLVFFASFVRGRDVGSAEVKRAIQGLVRAHWGLGARTVTNLLAPGLSGAEVVRVSRQQQRAASAEMAAELLTLTFDVDARQAAARVRAPALVLHRKGDRTVPLAAGRELAASLPDAVFRSLEGNAHVPWLGDVESVVEATVEFLGERQPVAIAEPPIAGNSLCRRGEVWTVTFAGRAVHLKHARGLEDLALLLANPGQEIHALTLWSGGKDDRRPVATAPVLDDAALASYRDRLDQLDRMIDVASAGADQAAAARGEAERDALLGQLRAAIGLGGRKRRLDDPSERARKAVSARLHATLAKLQQLNPALGEHLEHCVSIGMFCSYDPDNELQWVVSASS